jgi:hypothetical protein
MPWHWKEGMAQRGAQQCRTHDHARRVGLWLGWPVLLAVHLPIIVVAGAAGVWLFYVSTPSKAATGRAARSGTRARRPSTAVRSTTCRPAALADRQHRLSPHPSPGHGFPTITCGPRTRPCRTRPACADWACSTASPARGSSSGTKDSAGWSAFRAAVSKFPMLGSAQDAGTVGV